MENPVSSGAKAYSKAIDGKRAKRRAFLKLIRYAQSAVHKTERSSCCGLGCLSR